MKQQLSVSIITPSFNQKKFIGKTIDSVLAQNVKRLEYMVIDGGSTDGTLSILKKYKTNSNFRYISEKDRGQAHAINKGLRMATGDIIAYINSDDYYVPGALKTIVNYFTTHPNVMWVTGDCRIVDEHGKEIQQWIRLYKKFFRLFPLRLSLPILNPVAQPSTFWRREIMEKVGYFNEDLRYALDYEYWLRLLKFSSPHVISKALSCFRIHTASKGGQGYPSQFQEGYTVVATYEHRPLVLQLHKIHNAIITNMYHRIK